MCVCVIEENNNMSAKVERDIETVYYTENTCVREREKSREGEMMVYSCVRGWRMYV